MVRVLGNSVERLVINDIKDVIYYHQVKEYTDQEFESSKDLKRELSKGRITFLKSEPAPKTPGSAEDTTKINGKDIEELRDLIRSSHSSVNAREVAREIAPVVADIVRQEMSRIQVVAPSGSTATPKSSFVGPEYIPTISTEGMVSNVTADEREESADSANDALAALRKMKTGQ